MPAAVCYPLLLVMVCSCSNRSAGWVNKPVGSFTSAHGAITCVGVCALSVLRPAWCHNWAPGLPPKSCLKSTYCCLHGTFSKRLLHSIHTGIPYCCISCKSGPALLASHLCCPVAILSAHRWAICCSCCWWWWLIAAVSTIVGQQLSWFRSCWIPQQLLLWASAHDALLLFAAFAIWS